MPRTSMLIGLIMVVVLGGVTAAHAVDTPPPAQGQKTAPAAAPATAPATSAAPATTSNTSAPSITKATFLTGTLTALDLTAAVPTASPSLTVTTQDGQAHILKCPAELPSVWRDGRLSRLSDLKVGDNVTVRLEADKNGMSVVKSIQVKAAPQAASAAPASAATKAN